MQDSGDDKNGFPVKINVYHILLKNVNLNNRFFVCFKYVQVLFTNHFFQIIIYFYKFQLFPREYIILGSGFSIMVCRW